MDQQHSIEIARWIFVEALKSVPETLLSTLKRSAIPSGPFQLWILLHPRHFYRPLGNRCCMGGMVLLQVLASLKYPHRI
jgi:hypothetical protein